MGRHRKHTDKYNRVDLVGVTIGGAIHGVILSDEHDKYGHRYVTVQWFCNPKRQTIDRNCPACHGQPTRHRWDKIKSGEVKSCGRLKKKHYHEYLRHREQHPVMDINGKPIPNTARLKQSHKRKDKKQ
jgi:hypothetical protein